MYCDGTKIGFAAPTEYGLMIQTVLQSPDETPLLSLFKFYRCKDTVFPVFR
jgi:hypothetical protein